MYLFNIYNIKCNIYYIYLNKYIFIYVCICIYIEEYRGILDACMHARMHARIYIAATAILSL